MLIWRHGQCSNWFVNDVQAVVDGFAPDDNAAEQALQRLLISAVDEAPMMEVTGSR